MSETIGCREKTGKYCVTISQPATSNRTIAVLLFAWHKYMDMYVARVSQKISMINNVSQRNT